MAYAFFVVTRKISFNPKNTILIYQPFLTILVKKIKILTMIDLNQLKITPNEIKEEIIKNVKQRRKENNLTQEQLSRKSGVSLGSIKRFERTGEIALTSLIRIAIVLGCQEDFLQLFVKKQYQSIQEKGGKI